MRRPIRAALAALAAAAALAPAGESRAQVTGFGQTFTVPGANAFLQSVTTGALSGPTPGDPYTLDLFAVSGLTLTGPALFSRSVTGPVAPNQGVPIGLALVPSGTYAFLLRSDVGALSDSFQTDHLAGGEAIACGLLSLDERVCFAPAAPDDIDGFTADFLPLPTPEPGGAALTGAGVLAAGVLASRRRRA